MPLSKTGIIGIGRRRRPGRKTGVGGWKFANSQTSSGAAARWRRRRSPTRRTTTAAKTSTPAKTIPLSPYR
jgi:hypothetical protein